MNHCLTTTKHNKAWTILCAFFLDVLYLYNSTAPGIFRYIGMSYGRNLDGTNEPSPPWRKHYVSLAKYVITGCMFDTHSHQPHGKIWTGMISQLGIISIVQRLVIINAHYKSSKKGRIWMHNSIIQKTMVFQMRWFIHDLISDKLHL